MTVYQVTTRQVTEHVYLVETDHMEDAIEMAHQRIARDRGQGWKNDGDWVENEATVYKGTLEGECIVRMGECETCYGEGFTDAYYMREGGVQREKHQCWDCGGSGKKTEPKWAVGERVRWWVNTEKDDHHYGPIVQVFPDGILSVREELTGEFFKVDPAFAMKVGPK